MGWHKSEGNPFVIFVRHILGTTKMHNSPQKTPMQYSGAQTGLQEAWCTGDKSVTWSHYCFFFFPWGFLFRNCWKPEVIFLLVATGHTGIQNKQEFLSVCELTALSGHRLISVPLGQPIMRSSCNTTPLLLCHCAMWWPEKIIWLHERRISETVPSLGKSKMNFAA